MFILCNFRSTFLQKIYNNSIRYHIFMVYIMIWGEGKEKKIVKLFTFLRFESKTATLYLLGFSFIQNQSNATVSVSPGDNFFL